MGRICYLLFFFFFQAEDGIRDLTVTGVQTCALPIYGREIRSPARHFGLVDSESYRTRPGARVRDRATPGTGVARGGAGSARFALSGVAQARKPRASCRRLGGNRERQRSKVLSADEQGADAGRDGNRELAKTDLS